VTISAENLEHPVVEHMRRDFPRLLEHQTIGEALNWLREHPPTGPIIYFYVVDSSDRLLGIVPTRNLILEPYEKKISDILIRSYHSLSPKSTVLEACQSFMKHRLLALPVVDGSGRIHGMVDMSLYTDELSEVSASSKQDYLFQLIGVHLAAAKPTSALSAFRLRFPWLGCNLAAGILAAFMSGVYQNVLGRVVALAFFIPVVLNLAESVSSQSVSLTLELLRGQTPSWRSMLEKLRRESMTGLLLGLGSGAIVGLVALVWLKQSRVMLVLLGGIAGGVTGAALLGMAIPYVLRMIRLDPQVAAGPIALAGADIITLLIYLNLARWML
jgi:magnesium transporter